MPMRAGRFDHWGGGHVHTFPNEGSANGMVVFQPGDIVILPYCRYIQDEVRMTVCDGFIDKVEGGLDAKLMQDWLDDNRADAGGQGPLRGLPPGLGPEPAGPVVRHRPQWRRTGTQPGRGPHLPRQLPVLDPAPNNQGGGKRTTRGHYDVPMRDCTLELDGELIIENGRIIDDNMIVERIIHT